jgi:hypothetical protein
MIDEAPRASDELAALNRLINQIAIRAFSD